MKKIIYLSLGAVFLLFTLGAATAILNVTSNTDALSRLIELHEAEHLRQTLIINVQTVQTNLLSQSPAGAFPAQALVNNLAKLDRALGVCSTCHHPKQISNHLIQLNNIIYKYKMAIGSYIAASASPEAAQKDRAAATGFGNMALNTAQEMSFSATHRMQELTGKTLVKIKHAKSILFATLFVEFFLALAVSLFLIRRINRPLGELVRAAKRIASGELGYTIPVLDRTEFGELADNFNVMSLALKEGNDKIRESESKFRTLHEFSADWEYWIGADRQMIFNSPSCEKITGYNQAEINARPDIVDAMVHPEDRGRYDKHWNDDSSMASQEMEFRIVTKNGDVKWISHLCRPIIINGQFAGRRVSNRDITDRNELEEQLRQAQKMESLGLLAGGVAHDFNNLLTAILGYTSLLQQEAMDGSDKIKRYINQVLSTAERAKYLTANLLAFSRKQIMKQSVVSLNALLSNMFALLKSIIREDIEISIVCSDEELLVLADPNQIEQIIMNLVTNARDAMPDGGKLTIETCSTTFDALSAKQHDVNPGAYATLSISDTGGGMEEEVLSHIFEPFYTTKDKHRGTGLGLSIVYGIIKQHNGFIHVYSKKGGWGTIFKIYLPANTQGEASEHEGVAPLLHRETDLQNRGMILVGEDDKTIRELLKDLLVKYGYETILADNGREVFDKYLQYQDKIDLVILDVIMPKMNGKEVFDRIKEVTPAVKAIFISGYAKDVLTTKGVYEEGLEFVSKPISIPEILFKIRSLLN